MSHEEEPFIAFSAFCEVSIAGFAAVEFELAG